MRYLAVPGIVAALLFHLAAAFGVWNSARDPERPGGWVEASPTALTARAELELRIGLAALSDRARPTADRLEAYTDQLKSSRRLLTRSLAVNPAQPDALATLATIDYELAPGEPGTLEVARDRIETAALLAPRVPLVQAKLGELLLRMGYSKEALGYLARSVELDPANAERVVRLTLAHGFRAERIREALPQSATTLTAMRLAFEHDGRERYLEWVETALDGATVAATDELLWAYADGALGIGQPARLAEHLNGWGPFDDVETESSRLMQHARASRHLGQPDQALAWARRAHALAPESQRAARLLGDVARAASRPDLAIEAYRHGLGLLARRNAAPRQRAFLYRRIGEAQEELNRADLAYDAYVKALELHPEEPHALRRTAALVGKKN